MLLVWTCLFQASALGVAEPSPAAEPTNASDPIKWTVVFYVGFDEEELADRTAHLIPELLRQKLPPNVEFLIEEDNWTAQGKPESVKRYVHSAEGTKVEDLPEHDSANPGALDSFLKWVKKTARGKHQIFLLMTHSWGWKGTIQDFRIPGAPKDHNTMMPIHEFKKVFTENDYHPDILFLDTCNLGNAEVLHELQGISQYVIASQRETPFNGFPYVRLTTLLQDEALNPRELARLIPHEYVQAHSRSARSISLAPAEREYDVITATALDLKNWELFVTKFKELVALLKKIGFSKLIRENLDWHKKFYDNSSDSYVDVVEFLKRLPHFTQNYKVLQKTNELLSFIGYPSYTDHDTRKRYRIPSTHHFEIRIQADEILYSAEGKKKALERLEKRWKENNQDLRLPNVKMKLKYEGKRLLLVISGQTTTGFWFRPWLPGVKHFETGFVAKRRTNKHLFVRQKYSRKKDYFYVDTFPCESFLLSEAHSQGAPFIHGIGINLKPEMNDDEEHGFDPYLNLRGPNLYRASQWNKDTGWGDLIFGD